MTACQPCSPRPCALIPADHDTPSVEPGLGRAFSFRQADIHRASRRRAVQPHGRGALRLIGRQNPHRAADTPEHTEHEDDYAGN
jgi:hypothetical protein